jgi:hypothetical protein
MGAVRLTTAEQRVLAAYAALNVFPFAWAAISWSGFWTSIAPLATLLALAPLVALWRRKRWAWVVLVALDGSLLASYLSDPPHWFGAALGGGQARALALAADAPVRSRASATRPGLQLAVTRPSR